MLKKQRKGESRWKSLPIRSKYEGKDREKWNKVKCLCLLEESTARKAEKKQ